MGQKRADRRGPQRRGLVGTSHAPQGSRGTRSHRTAPLSTKATQAGASCPSKFLGIFHLANHPLMYNLPDKWKHFLPHLQGMPPTRVLNSKNSNHSPLPQFWTTLKGHPFSSTEISWSLSCECVTVQCLHLPSPASLFSSQVMLLRIHLKLTPEVLCLRVYFPGNPT